MATNFQFDKTINPGAGSDASPRASAPDPSRVFQVPVDPNDPRRGSAITLALDDGTSAAATFWVRDDATGTWYQVGGSVTALPGAMTDPVVLPAGADYFVRVGAVAGSPTKLRVGFVVVSAVTSTAASTVTANQGTAGASPWPVTDAAAEAALSPIAAAANTPAAGTGTSSAVQLGSNVCMKGFWIQADGANTTNLRIGDSGITTSRGFQLFPGDARWVDADNTNRYYVIAESGSPKYNLDIR